MNIIIIKENLKEILDILSRVSGGHSTLPILKNILIQTKENVITLIATNLEIGIKCHLAGKIVKDGDITIPASLLAQVVSNLSEERVEMITEDLSLRINTESYSANIQGSPASEFPTLPTTENKENYIEIENDVLRSCLESVLSATQFSELRPELSSVYFQFFGDKIVVVATDSFRLAEKTINESQFKANIEGEFKILIPLYSAQELVRILKDKGSVRIYPDPNQILFKTERVELISRILEGTFPDYQAVVPKEYQAEVAVSREDLVSAIKLTGVMSGTAAEVSLRSGKDGGLEIFSRDERLGENTYQLKGTLKGSFREASFNWKYLLEGAKSLSTKDVVLGLNDENRPAILRSAQDRSYFYILMPVLKG